MAAAHALGRGARRRFLPAGGLVLPVLLLGCGTTVEPAGAPPGAPSSVAAVVPGIGLDRLGLDGVDLEAQLEVRNGGGRALRLTRLLATLASGSHVLVSGATPLDVALDPGAEVSLPWRARLDFNAVQSRMPSARPGRTVAVELALAVACAAEGDEIAPASAKAVGEIPIPASPEVALARDPDRPSGFLLRIRNRNAFPMDVAGVTAVATVAGRRAPCDRVEPMAPIEPGASAVLPLSCPGAAADAEAALVLQGTLDALTPFGPMSIPILAATDGRP